MADIITVKQLTQGYRKLEPGKTYIVVDGVRNRILKTIQVQQNPKQVEQTFKRVYYEK